MSYETVDGFTVSRRAHGAESRWDFSILVTYPGIYTQWQTFGCGGETTIESVTAALLTEARELVGAILAR
jgi:hypothetical protein